MVVCLSLPLRTCTTMIIYLALVLTGGCDGWLQLPVLQRHHHHPTGSISSSSSNTARFSSSSSSSSVARTHPTFESKPLEISSALSSSPPTPDAEKALASLAATTLALLSGDEEQAASLLGGAKEKRDAIRKAFGAYDVCSSGTLSVDEARALFVDLSRSIVTDIANNQKNTVARAHANRVLRQDESGNTIERIAMKLLLMADTDLDGRVSLPELANLFDTVHDATTTNKKKNNNTRAVQETFPQPLRALAGSLQLLPHTQGTAVAEAALSDAAHWGVGVPGDDHTLRRVEVDDGKLSIVGLGRSADASAYFLPELGIVLDAGIHVKSIKPRTVLLTHGHRDHIAALPTHAAAATAAGQNKNKKKTTKIFAPKPISSLVRRFLLAEAQLNYGDAAQTDEETVAALGDFDVNGVEDGDEIMLPRECYTGSPTPLGIQVFRAPHKDGVPAVSYGLFRAKKRLRAEYAALPKSELGALIRNDVEITEPHHEGVLFYTGDTTIRLLRERWEDILPKYKHVIHEVTFLGKPSSELDESTRRKGHTHYSQLHPWICSFPETTFICVHWSLRYSREDVLRFFEDEYGGVPSNVVLWI